LEVDFIYPFVGEGRLPSEAAFSRFVLLCSRITTLIDHVRIEIDTLITGGTYFG
jgi:hypothetical protein